MAVVFADTNIVIEYLKEGMEGFVAERFRDFENIYINDVVIMELFQGAKNKKELAYIKKRIQRFTVLQMNHEIIALARDLVEHYTLSHTLKIMDAMIAATALSYHLDLYTLNTKDFRYIPFLKLI